MKSLFRISIGFVVCALTAGIFLTSSATPQLTSGTQARADAAAAPLRDGRIWITGGAGSTGALASVNLLNLDGSSSPVAPMILARSKHAAVVLNDGRLLVAGGDTGSGATNETEIYDPASDRWDVGPPMIASRSGHTASLLTDGRVLIAGGAGAGAPGVTLEIFDPRNGGFSLAGTLETSRQNHAAAVLRDGRVLIVGGFSSDGALASSEIYDPASGISSGPSLSTGRAKATATTLRDGRVLVAGGSDGLEDLASAEIYDAVTNSFSPGPALSEPRSGHNAFVLLGDNILIQGGTRGTAEFYIPPYTGSLSGRAPENGVVHADKTAGTLMFSRKSGSLPTDVSPVTSTSLTGVNLSTYVRVGRFDLPEPTRTTPPANSLLAQEVSAVTYDWDTKTLFVVGDGGTSIVQVEKTGKLIDSMTLAPGGSPQGTEFYDPEGLTYIGGGKFVMSEERDRQAVSFTYVAGTMLTRSGAQTVKLGTFVDNIGIEGISYDPLTTGYVAVKETQPQGIFQTGIDFVAGTATNGSSTTENSINLFDPALANLLDFADVFALSNLSSLSGPAANNLLVLSQESGKIVNIDRSGNISSSLTIVSDPGNPLSVSGQQHEGLTMDNDGFLYVVSENGGGDINHPQLWVYAPSSVPNQAPTAVVLNNQVNTIAENTSTASPIKVADIAVTDDGLGTNNLSVSGTDASFFEITGNALYIKAGTVLDFETKTSYSVTVNVDDTTVGSTPDASTIFTLAVTDIVNENPSLPTVIISEVSAWSNNNSPYMADWFEVTNTGASALNIIGWKMDDNSNSFGNSVALRGVTTIPAGKSAIFFEGDATGTTDAAITASFSTAWFGSPTPPAGVLIGAYGGSGVGLSNSGDAVNLFDAAGNRITGVSFGTSTTGITFDNKAGLGSTTLPLPTISTSSVAGVNGAFLASDGAETGSPGTIAASVIISEVSAWSNNNSPYMADWFEVTNTGAIPVAISGWRMDDNSNSFGNSVALRGVTTIPAGKSAIFFEGDATGTTDAAITASFSTAWFVSPTPPAGVLIGAYGGSGVGLSNSGDAVNLFDAAGNRITGVSFGTSTTGITFDNKAGLGSTTLPLPTISTSSVAGVNGAFLASDGAETGSPGTIAASVIISEVSAWSNNNSPYMADWFEVTNTGAIPVAISGWRMDDNSNSFGNSVALRGVTTIPAGKSAIFFEGDPSGVTDAAIITSFSKAWFGSATPPTGVLIGAYGGSGVGLSNSGDAVNLFDAAGNRITGVSFGASTTGITFDNKAGIGSTTLPLPTISTLSVAGVNGAFLASDGVETGSPGPIASVNHAPTAIVLNNQVNTIPENANTTTRIRVADITVTDDALGTNVLSLSGNDASFFEIVSSALYLKANTSVDFETKSGYAVTVAVDDPIVLGTPDATTNFTLAVTDINEASFFLHGTGATANPDVLFLNTTVPTSSTSKYKDSAAVNFSGGNPWKEIGIWGGASPRGTLTASVFRTWIGLKNSDDQGARFDLRVEVYKNENAGLGLVAFGETYCVQGVTRNANSAVAAELALSSLSGVLFTGSEQLSVRVLTRIGTDDGAFCGGHNSATGLRLYFDAAAMASQLFPN